MKGVETPSRAHRSALRRWLCPSDADVVRMVNNAERGDGARQAMGAVLTLGMAALVPWLGWWPFILGFGSAIAMITLFLNAERLRRPEYVNASAFVFTLLTFVVASLLTGGPDSPILPLTVLPFMLLANRFRPQVVGVALAVAALLLLAVTALPDPGALRDNPIPAVFTLALIGGTVLVTLQIRRIEGNLRAASQLDELTGTLNRGALDQIYRDLSARSVATARPVALVLFDVDRFKDVNERRGHDVGDEVLAGVATVLRRELRGHDALFRIGGEEFAVLLPDTELADALAIAEQQRAAVRAQSTTHGITISGGVAVAHGGMEWHRLYRAADRALLEAKRNGRDRIVAENRGGSFEDRRENPEG